MSCVALYCCTMGCGIHVELTTTAAIPFIMLVNGKEICTVISGYMYPTPSPIVSHGSAHNSSTDTDSLHCFPRIITAPCPDGCKHCDSNFNCTRCNAGYHPTGKQYPSNSCQQCQSIANCNALTCADDGTNSTCKSCQSTFRLSGTFDSCGKGSVTEDGIVGVQCTCWAVVCSSYPSIMCARIMCAR